MNLGFVCVNGVIRIFDVLLKASSRSPALLPARRGISRGTLRGAHPSLPKTILPPGFCDQPHDLHRAHSVIVNPCKGAPIWQEEVSIKSFFSEIWARTPS